jgi:uroporphyrinogen-III decarboxylase
VSLFYAFYDQPDLVRVLLEIVTQTYIDCMRAWVDIVPFRQGGNAHWGLFHQGNIMLRDDSAMNLSPAMFDAFVRPYDQRLLDEFGGGAVHFCGRGDHYVASLSEMEGLHALNISQPEYNDMEAIYAHTADKGIKIIGLGRAAAEKAVAGGRNLRGQVHAL